MIPILEQYIAKHKGDAGTPRIKQAVSRIKRGERPSEPFQREDD